MDDAVAGFAVIIAGWTVLTRATAWWRKNNNSVGQGLQPTWHRLETAARAALDQWRTYQPPPPKPTT
jgi:hypothetical protein